MILHIAKNFFTIYRVLYMILMYLPLLSKREGMRERKKLCFSIILPAYTGQFVSVPRLIGQGRFDCNKYFQYIHAMLSL